MKMKDYGWVIENGYLRKKKRKKRFALVEKWVSLKYAYVYSTRRHARICRIPHNYETVCKVSLTKNGKPKTIIGRG